MLEKSDTSFLRIVDLRVERNCKSNLVQTCLFPRNVWISSRMFLLKYSQGCGPKELSPGPGSPLSLRQLSPGAVVAVWCGGGEPGLWSRFRGSNPASPLPSCADWPSEWASLWPRCSSTEMRMMGIVWINWADLRQRLEQCLLHTEVSERSSAVIQLLLSASYYSSFGSIIVWFLKIDWKNHPIFTVSSHRLENLVTWKVQMFCFFCFAFLKF